MKNQNLFFLSLKLLFYSTILKPLYDFPSNIFGIQVGFIEKVINFLFLFSTCFLILHNKRIRLHSFSVFLIFIIIVSTIFGIYYKTLFSFITFSQLYYFLMPLICISAGGEIYKNCGEEFNLFVLKVSGKLFWFLFFLTVLYIILHNFTSYWVYFGYSSGIIFTYLTVKKESNFKLYAGIFIDLFTGKRSTLAMWGFILSLKKPIIFFTIIIFIFIFLFSIIPFIPQRYIDVFYFSISDERSMFLATGGRSVEWFGIIEKIKNNPYSLYTGFGFGSSYQLYDMFQDLWETRHYSHLTPFSYLLIAGIFATIIIYSYLIYFAFVLYNEKYAYMYYYFIIMVFLSVSGGGLLAMPLPWVFLGILLYLKEINFKYKLT